jgi:aminopeptidase N
MLTWSRVVPIVLVAGLAAASVRGDTYPRQPGIDVLDYVFRLTVSDETDEIVGDTTVDVRFLQNDVAGFSLDLASKTSDKGMTVTAVAVAGKPVRYEHKDDRLRIALDPVPTPAERRSIAVSYRGVPRGGLRIGKNRHGERTFFSENWPDKARQWLPTVDHPYDKATNEFYITAPARYQVVANGLLQEERDLGDGRRLTHWKQSVPIPTWLNAVGVAQFAAHHGGAVKGVPLESWVYHQDRDPIVAALETASRRVIEFYSEHVGPFPYEKLASVQAASVGGGMENASAIFYGERSVHGRDVTGLVAHEIAHQWFGDSVTERDWDDVWLSEGFATYFALLFTEHDRGRDAFLAGLKRSRDAIFVTEKRNPDLAVIHSNLSDTRRILNGLVYQKGGWTLHMLRGLIGTEAFWAGIRDYYHRYRDGNASTDDFRRVMEENSGRELSWYFKQWLNRAGSPVVEGSWRYRPENKRIEIELAQTQTGDPYRLPIEVAIALDGASATRIEKLELTQQQQRFEFPADKAPASVTLDPNCWVLMKAIFAVRPAK